MTFLYHDSNKWNRGWRDFVPFEMPNSIDQMLKQRRKRAMPSQNFDFTPTSSEGTTQLDNLIKANNSLDRVPNDSVPKFERFITVMRDLDKEPAFNK